MWKSSAHLQCRFRALGLKVAAQFSVERVQCVLSATAVAMNATASWCNGRVRSSVVPCASFAALCFAALCFEARARKRGSHSRMLLSSR